jgi:hypothetical protein
MSGVGRDVDAGRARKRANLTLGDQARSVLERVKNASGYVNRAVCEREQLWRRALEQLSAMELAPPALYAACEAVRELPPLPLPAQVVGALRGAAMDAEERWKIEREEWRALVRQVERGPHLATALLVLTAELYARNLAVAEALAALEQAQAGDA